MGKSAVWQRAVTALAVICIAAALAATPAWAVSERQSDQAQGGQVLADGIATQAEQPLAAGAAALQATGTSVTSGALTVSGLQDFGGLVPEWGDSYPTFIIEVNGQHPQGDIMLESSNPEVVEPAGDGYVEWLEEDEPISCEGECKVSGYGVAYITVSLGDDAVTFPIVIRPDDIRLKGAAKESHHQVKLTWNTRPGISGCLVQRALAAEDYWGTKSFGWDLAGKYETIARVEGDTATSTLVEAPWNVAYQYRLLPYVSYGGDEYYPEGFDFDGEEGASEELIVRLLPPAVTLSAAKSGASGTKLTWEAEPGATSYQVLRSSYESSGYQVIAKPSSTSYTDTKAKKGVRYCYKVRAVYGSAGSSDSNSCARFTAAKSKAQRRVVSNVDQEYSWGEYGWNWASPDKTMYYTSGSKLYAACYLDGKLKVYGLNSSLSRVSAKTVSLPKHDVWGGFYHGPDGNNYVALGYNNPKESKSKVVIKVIKFSSGWKKGKTASIAGSASNEFDGIYHPFAGGSASFDMQGDTLYLFTCREMFADDGGVHHQSNIAFSIDTKKMKARVDNHVYTSHSFNQRVRIKDGTMYLADHGDAFPRGIALGVRARPEIDGSSYLREYVPFKFMGSVGDNFTGATMGGMEVGANTVLVCGTAQPHKLKVAGVTGFKSNYKQNAYVTVTDLATGKSSVKWLTSINPKSGKQTVGNVRMVKLSDDRFAVLYAISNDKTRQSTLHYDVLNAAGKRVLSKTYKNYAFSGSAQPVLFNGSIVWSECSYNRSEKQVAYYKVPAL